MKNILLVIVAAAFTFGATTVLACPPEAYEVFQVALDANGVMTRTETHEVPAYDDDEDGKKVWETVVVDRIALVPGDVVKLNAAPGMMDARVTLEVKRTAQKSDAKGTFFTSYQVRQIVTSEWGGEPSDKSALVTVRSTYLGKGKRAKGCGSVEVTKLPGISDAQD